MLLAPEDEDIRAVALRLREQFARQLPAAVVTRIVWQACRELSLEVPRASLAEFTHRSAQQRLAELNTGGVAAGATVTRAPGNDRATRRRIVDSRAA